MTQFLSLVALKVVKLTAAQQHIRKIWTIRVKNLPTQYFIVADDLTPFLKDKILKWIYIYFLKILKYLQSYKN